MTEDSFYKKVHCPWCGFPNTVEVDDYTAICIECRQEFEYTEKDGEE